MARRLQGVTGSLVAGLLLSACSSSTVNTTPTVTTSTTVQATTSTLGVSTTSGLGVVQNLRVTLGVRQSLLRAAAAFHQLPTSDYAGLRPGETYYAFDPATQRYYAAAGLMASSTSLPAQIGTQDDGAYNLFTRGSGTAAWSVYSDGLGGVVGTHCPLSIPAAVLEAWHWSAHSCFPPSPTA